MEDPNVFVRRASILNFKSIKACQVDLGPLTVLVGPNGSGKSNFLDALRFTADALNTTLDHALRDRGGVNEVRRRSGGHPTHFQIGLVLNLPNGAVASYGFRVGALGNGGFQVTDERCEVDAGLFGESAHYEIKRGELSTSVAERLPAPAPDRLFLVSASSLPVFRPVFDALASMGFYNLSPATIRGLQQPDPGTLLRRDGSNLASVLGNLEDNHPEALDRITEYLRLLAPGTESVQRKLVAPMETIEFRQQVAGQSAPWRFGATNMSDGTLRGLGVLVALLQSNGRRPSLVAIEEPEVALHPAAVGVLIDAIREAARHTQVLVTSHSPDLLDRQDLSVEDILAVRLVDGISEIGRIDEPMREVLRRHLFTPGELLRMSQLEPSQEAAASAQADRLPLLPS